MEHFIVYYLEQAVEFNGVGFEQVCYHYNQRQSHRHLSQYLLGELIGDETC